MLLAAAPASAGKFNPLTYDPNPVPAGETTTASGTCSTEASFVNVVFDLQLSDGGEAFIDIDIDVDPDTGEFSGDIDIPSDAIVQTVQTSGTCIATTDGEFAVGFLQGDLSISEPLPPPTTAAPTTTTIATTTTAAPTTTTPSTTLGPVTLPNTGAGSSSGSTAAIGAAALAVGIGLILVARRRSADA